MLDFFC
jgi:hypothetical protein